MRYLQYYWAHFKYDAVVTLGAITVAMSLLALFFVSWMLALPLFLIGHGAVLYARHKLKEFRFEREETKNRVFHSKSRFE